MSGLAKKKLIAGAGVLGASLAVAFWAWRAFGPQTYRRFKTMFGKTRVYEVLDDEGEPVRLLEVGGIVQSGTYLDERYTELVFEYLKTYDVMFEAARPVRRVCVLGCGGYDYPEHLVAHTEVVVDAVEIDPAITAIARRFFHLDRLIEEFATDENGRLNLICSDALSHLERTDERYDAIVNDTFDAGTPAPELTTLYAAQLVHDRLEEGGLYLTNIVAALEGPRAAFLREQAGLLGSVFSHVVVIPCATERFGDEDNVIVVATDADPSPILAASPRARECLRDKVGV